MEDFQNNLDITEKRIKDQFKYFCMEAKMKLNEILINSS
jgi:hypothetical protein